MHPLIMHVRSALGYLLVASSLLVAGCSSDSDEKEATDPGHDTGQATDTQTSGETDASDTDSAEETDTSELPEPEIVPIFDDIRISSLGDDEYFQTATLPFDLGEGPFANVTLTIQLDSTCYPFDEWGTVPPGHNWPADCDAYDRNFDILLNPPDAEGDAPAFEVVRAITPFGGPMTIEADITDWANVNPGENELRIHITTWSDGQGQVSGSAGGWNVTADASIQRGEAPRNVLAVIPLVSESYTNNDSEPRAFTFEIPEGTISARLEYRTTGHGGGPSDSACIGHADEFCRRFHHVIIDGRNLGVWQPWRDDCDTLCTWQESPFGHCLENPCGHPDSVRAPRANWCPGDTTDPDIFEPEELTEPGEHTFEYLVENVAEGGSWRTTAAVFAYGD